MVLMKSETVHHELFGLASCMYLKGRIGSLPVAIPLCLLQSKSLHPQNHALTIVPCDVLFAEGYLFAKKGSSLDALLRRSISVPKLRTPKRDDLGGGGGAAFFNAEID